MFISGLCFPRFRFAGHFEKTCAYSRAECTAEFSTSAAYWAKYAATWSVRCTLRCAIRLCFGYMGVWIYLERRLVESSCTVSWAVNEAAPCVLGVPIQDICVWDPGCDGRCMDSYSSVEVFMETSNRSQETCHKVSCRTASHTINAALLCSFAHSVASQPQVCDLSPTTATILQKT